MQSGFVYCVSRTGVTGAKQDVPVDLRNLVGRIKQKTALPVCVGFGISSGAHVANIVSFADGVVIGSALVDRLQKSAGTDWRRDVLPIVREWKSFTNKPK
jgi:tryptophan synthase alpha chain